jgi:hypothetical protein
MTGTFSPDEGIARVSIADDSAFACPCDPPTGKHNPAALTPSKRVASRRVIWVVLSVVASSEVVGQAVALCEGLETSLISNDNSKRFLDFAQNDKKG